MRLGLIVVREDEFSIDREVTVLQSLRCQTHPTSFPTGKELYLSW